jgi:hypothetical protein
VIMSKKSLAGCAAIEAGPNADPSPARVPRRT